MLSENQFGRRMPSPQQTISYPDETFSNNSEVPLCLKWFQSSIRKKLTFDHWDLILKEGQWSTFSFPSYYSRLLFFTELQSRFVCCYLRVWPRKFLTKIREKWEQSCKIWASRLYSSGEDDVFGIQYMNVQHDSFEIRSISRAGIILRGYKTRDDVNKNLKTCIIFHKAEHVIYHSRERKIWLRVRCNVCIVNSQYSSTYLGSASKV